MATKITGKKRLRELQNEYTKSFTNNYSVGLIKMAIAHGFDEQNKEINKLIKQHREETNVLKARISNLKTENLKLIVLLKKVSKCAKKSNVIAELNEILLNETDLVLKGSKKAYLKK